jgi:hypothetical protein
VLKNKVGLTDTEISLVNEVALSCKGHYDAKTFNGAAEVRQLAAQNPQRSLPSAAVAARINALELERTKLLSDCMDSLKRGMGAARYAKLQDYARAQGTAIRFVDPSTPDVNGKPTPPPDLIPRGNGPSQGGLK